MINCYACFKEISHTAQACPKCGDTNILKAIKREIQHAKENLENFQKKKGKTVHLPENHPLIEKLKNEEKELEKEFKNAYIWSQIMMAQHNGDVELENKLNEKINSETNNNENSSETNNNENSNAILHICAQIIVKEQNASSSLINRETNIGYNKAGRIIDELETLSIIGPFQGSNPREVYFKDIDSLNKYLVHKGLIKSIQDGRVKKGNKFESTVKKSEKKGCAFTFISISIIMLSIGYYFI